MIPSNIGRYYHRSGLWEAKEDEREYRDQPWDSQERLDPNMNMTDMKEDGSEMSHWRRGILMQVSVF